MTGWFQSPYIAQPLCRKLQCGEGLWGQPVHTTFTSLPAQTQKQESALTEVQYQSLNNQRRGWKREAFLLGTDLGAGIYTKGTVHSLHFLVSMKSLTEIILGLCRSLCILETYAYNGLPLMTISEYSHPDTAYYMRTIQTCQLQCN